MRTEVHLSSCSVITMISIFDDNSVSLENSLLFVEALRKNGVKFEYHVFPDGCHGLGLGTKETATKGGKHYQPEVYAWTSLFKQWMDRYE